MASALAGSMNFTLGVTAGGALMTGDVFLIMRVATGLLGEEPPDEQQARKLRRKLLLQYLLKVIGLFVILGVLIWKTEISPAGLLIGITASILGPMYVGLRDADFEE